MNHCNRWRHTHAGENAEESRKPLVAWDLPLELTSDAVQTKSLLSYWLQSDTVGKKYYESRYVLL